jgi:hypothetical protein
MTACCCGGSHDPGQLQVATDYIEGLRVPEHVAVTTPYGTWQVQRLYIALHGLKAIQLPALAQRYGWEEKDE